jgi:hypothetical protein
MLAARYRLVELPIGSCIMPNFGDGRRVSVLYLATRYHVTWRSKPAAELVKQSYTFIHIIDIALVPALM